MSDDIELEFKRFSKDKQEQIRQLVSFATLMGLSGKDLVSIGGKLDRIAARRDMESRLAVVKAYDIQPIGKDTHTMDRFKLELDGVMYHFKNDYGNWDITNTQTKKSKMHYNRGWMTWGRIDWRIRERYNFLWDLYQGQVTLP